MTTTEAPITLEQVRSMSVLERANLTSAQKRELKTLLAQRRMDKMTAADVSAGITENARFCAATVEVLAYAIATMAARFDRPDLALKHMTEQTVEQIILRTGEIAAEMQAGLAVFKAEVAMAEKAKGE